jgi:hypothetical protein
MQNIIGIVPAYQGGHHIANMISTDPNYANRFNEGDYELVNYNAHVNPGNFGRLHLDMIEHISNNLQVYINQNNVFTSHFGEFINFKYSKIYDLFQNKRFYCVTFPNNPSLETFLRKRAYYHNDMAYYDALHFYGEFKFHYNPVMLSDLLSENITEISSEIVFTSDCAHFIEVVNNGLGLNLRYNIVQPLHEKWFNKLQNSVENIPEPPQKTQIKIWYK